MTIIDYKIIESSDKDVFQSRIEVLSQKGYKLHGYLSVIKDPINSHLIYIQVMVRELYE